MSGISKRNISTTYTFSLVTSREIHIEINRMQFIHWKMIFRYEMHDKTGISKSILILSILLIQLDNE